MATANLKSELEAIRLKHGGLLTEEAILVEARSSKHPLHDRFTWNNTRAAKQWRLEEARTLIRSVYITIERPRQQSVTVRAYASLPSDREAQGGYRAITDVLSNKALRKEMLETALAELEAFRKRYGTLSQLAPVFTAIEAVKIRKPERAVKSPPKPRRSAEARI